MAVTEYAVNGDGSAYVDIPCTIYCRKMRIVEVPSVSGADQATFSPQGLQYKLRDDGYTLIHQALPAEEIVLGNEIAEGNAFGKTLGMKAQKDHYGNTRAADVPIKLLSGSATATRVKVIEVE